MLKKLIARINKQYRSLLGGFMVVLSVLTVASSVSGCKHEPLVPIVNGGNGGGGDDDDTSGTGIPCDPNTVYFEQQVLPILIANCAKSGCHDAASAEEGVILNNYNNVMTTGEVTPFNLGDSEIWEVINETDPDKVMPPPGENPLTPAQINLIAQWINQGAQNVFCDDNLGPCDSVAVSYATDVQPIIQNKCLGCHGTANSGNAFISLANHTGVAASASTGQLVGSITHNPNYTAMPSNGPMLNDCEIAKIKNWVSEGALNN